MKLKLIALAALAVATSSSFAAIQDATSGNGELVVNFQLYNGDQYSGGDDMSALFDLGITMNSFIANAAVAGYTQTWNLTASNYGSAWSTLNSFNPALNSAIEFNVIALDNNATTPGGARYLSTASTTTFPSLPNNNLINFQNMNGLLVDNQTRGTHGTQANGASTATSADPQNTYFGAADGSGGDNWALQTSADTTKTLNTALNFFLLTNSSTSGVAQSTRTAFGTDLNGSGTVSGAAELGKWTVNQAAGTITYANPVPEAETYAMLLAGLGALGAVVRRRKSKAQSV